MARKTAAAEAADPVAARVALIERVKARRPPDIVRSYPSLNAGAPPMVQRIPAAEDRLPPKDLGEWCDDRTLATFGGECVMNVAQQAAFTILESMRADDPKAVQEAVRRAGDGLDSQLRFAVASVLETWRGSAPGYAISVAATAADAARRQGWHGEPRRSRKPRAA
jgi:hypothetical protein